MFVLKNNTTIQITDATGVVGWGYAEPYTTSAGVTGQLQRYSLKPGYAPPPGGTCQWAVADQRHQFATLAAWTSALNSGQIWTPNAGWTYVKANCLAYTSSPPPTSSQYPTWPGPTPPTAPSLATTALAGEALAPDDEPALTVSVPQGGLRIVGTFGGLPVDVIVTPAGAVVAATAVAGTNAALQLDGGPTQITQNGAVSRAFTEVASYWQGTHPRQSYEHWALAPAWQTPDAAAASLGQPPSTERPSTLSAWSTMIQGFGWPTGSAYVIAACNYYHGTLPNPV